MTEIHVAASSAYDVTIGPGASALVPDFVRRAARTARRLCVVTDSTVDRLFAEPLRAQWAAAGLATEKFVFPAGEASKTLATYADLVGFLAARHFDRTDLLLALGGGVTGDLTGFAAATFKRAMGFIQLPTSLLAMVDSSVGGKTGVNLAAGKNLVGAFHQPLAVFCDSDFLETLPDGRRMDGMGEVLKYAILGDQALFERLEKEPSRPVGEKEIAACLAMKQRIVEQDEREQGLRKYLNLGHTFGHAIEQASGYARSHGWAVATGIAMAARLSKNFNHLAAADCARIEALVSAMGYDLHAGFPAADLVAAILSDKKIAGDEIDLILPVSTCRCLAKRVPLAVLREEVERVR